MIALFRLCSLHSSSNRILFSVEFAASKASLSLFTSRSSFATVGDYLIFYGVFTLFSFVLASFATNDALSEFVIAIPCLS